MQQPFTFSSTQQSLANINQHITLCHKIIFQSKTSLWTLTRVVQKFVKFLRCSSSLAIICTYLLCTKWLIHEPKLIELHIKIKVLCACFTPCTPICPIPRRYLLVAVLEFVQPTFFFSFFFCFVFVNWNVMAWLIIY